MPYVEGFVIPVPEGKKQEYLDLARKAYVKFKAWGVLRHVECWSDDVPEGEVTDFRRAVDAKPGEAIVFAWLEWPSREARDAANRKMMEDPEMAAMAAPFDGKRMILGGFLPIFDEGSGR